MDILERLRNRNRGRTTYEGKVDYLFDAQAEIEANRDRIAALELVVDIAKEEHRYTCYSLTSPCCSLADAIDAATGEGE